MSEGTFKKVGKSAKTLYGPRAALVCGFSPAEQTVLMAFLESIQVTDLSVIFSGDGDEAILLKDLLARPDQSGRDMEATMARAIILSGIREEELHRTLSSYPKAGLPRPLWATLTPYSEGWPLSALLTELEKERMAMEKKTP